MALTFATHSDNRCPGHRPTNYTSYSLAAMRTTSAFSIRRTVSVLLLTLLVAVDVAAPTPDHDVSKATPHPDLDSFELDPDLNNIAQALDEIMHQYDAFAGTRRKQADKRLLPDDNESLGKDQQLRAPSHVGDYQTTRGLQQPPPQQQKLKSQFDVLDDLVKTVHQMPHHPHVSRKVRPLDLAPTVPKRVRQRGRPRKNSKQDLIRAMRNVQMEDPGRDPVSKIKRRRVVRTGKDDKYCICNGRDDGRDMIQCDTCEGWFHDDCVGVDVAAYDEDDPYKCPRCQ